MNWRDTLRSALIESDPKPTGTVPAPAQSSAPVTLRPLAMPDTSPVAADNSTVAGMARNRRVQVVLGE